MSVGGEKSMDKGIKVDIKMESTSMVDGDTDSIELMTEGYLRQSVHEGIEGWEISYDDTEATGFVGSTTIVSVFGDSYASMQRVGSAESLLIIERHHCHYSTDEGGMMIGIFTRDIDNTISKEGGHLYMHYVIDINSILISENEVYITVKPK